MKKFFSFGTSQQQQQQQITTKVAARPVTSVIDKPTNYFEERMYDYFMIKRENQILREENKLLRGEILKRTAKMEKTELLELLELQRKRIDNLEREYDSLLGQMSDMKPKDQSRDGVLNMENSAATFELQEKLESSERRNRVLQEQIDGMALTYAKQIAQLKARMTEQGAQLLISAESGNMLPKQMTPNLHSSGVLKKRTATNGSSARLDPIDTPSGMRQSYQQSTIQHDPSPSLYEPYNNSGRNLIKAGSLHVPGSFQQQFNSYNTVENAYGGGPSSISHSRQIPYGQSLPLNAQLRQQLQPPAQSVAMNQFYSQFQLK